MYQKYSTASLDRSSSFNYPTACGRMGKETKPVQVKPNAAPNIAEHNKTYKARKGLGLLTAMPTRAHIQVTSYTITQLTFFSVNDCTLISSQCQKWVQ